MRANGVRMLAVDERGRASAAATSAPTGGRLGMSWPVYGTGGRGFKSRRPDQTLQ
jgi:hypothetical protein